MLTKSNTLHFWVKRAEAACVKTPSHVPTQSSNKKDTSIVLIRYPYWLIPNVHENENETGIVQARAVLWLISS